MSDDFRGKINELNLVILRKNLKKFVDFWGKINWLVILSSWFDLTQKAQEYESEIVCTIKVARGNTATHMKWELARVQKE